MASSCPSEHCGFAPAPRTCQGCRRVDYAGYPECQRCGHQLEAARPDNARAALRGEPQEAHDELDDSLPF